MNNGIILLLALAVASSLIGNQLDGEAVGNGCITGHQFNGPSMSIHFEEFPVPPVSVVEEYFLTLPDEYIVPPGESPADFSENARRAILAKSASKPDKVEMEVLDPSNGYLRFTTTVQGGKWVSEMTYFNNSLKERIVAVNHVWNGKHRFTHSIYFLEKTSLGWRDRTAGVIPEFSCNHLAFASSTLPALTLEQIWSGSIKALHSDVSKRSLLFVLPRVGKELVVQRAHESVKSEAASIGAVKLQWKDGVFGPERSVLDDYAGLDGAFLQIDTQEPFRLIPQGKDNIPSRMKCIMENQSIDGKIRIGSHPSVNVHEGGMELTRWKMQIGGQAKDILVLIGTVGLDGSPSELRFLELNEGKWEPSRSLPLPEIDLDRINTHYSQLPAEERLFDQIGLSELTIESDLDAPGLLIKLKESFTSGSAALVFMRLEFDGKRWQVME